MNNQKTAVFYRFCTLAAVLVCWCGACASSGTRSSQQFEFREGVITQYTGTEKRLVIPPSVNGQPVIAIGYYAFAFKELTSVAIPSSVTSIKDWAFADNQLTSVTIPDNVSSIGYSAFAGNLLTSVSIPGSVGSIGHDAFANNKLTSVIIGPGVTIIGNSAFDSNNLASITIGSNVTLNNTFRNDFDAFYNTTGKRAGTYIYDTNAKRWSLRPY